MKITIETTEPDDERTIKLMLQANDMASALWDISNDVFRPARKHGYQETSISKFFHEGLPESELAGRTELVAALESRFHEILDQWGVRFDEL